MTDLVPFDFSPLNTSYSIACHYVYGLIVFIQTTLHAKLLMYKLATLSSYKYYNKHLVPPSICPWTAPFVLRYTNVLQIMLTSYWLSCLINRFLLKKFL